jgi:hypothetical protein
MWEIKLINYVPATQGPDGESFLYSLVRSRETGLITASLRNLRTFPNEEAAKTYLKHEFHRNLVLSEIYHTEEQNGISVIEYVPSTQMTDGDTYIYSLVGKNDGVNARLENLRIFKSEEDATRYLKSEFHEDLVLFTIVDWRPLCEN